MLLTEKHIIKQSNKYYKLLMDELHKSKNLYNSTLYELRQEYFKSKAYIPYAKLQQIFQNQKQPDYYSLPAKVAQWTMKMVDYNYKSFFKANIDYAKNPSKYKGRPKLPKYLDKNGAYMLMYTSQAISKKELDTFGVIKFSGIDVRISSKIKYENLNCVRVLPKLNHIVIEVVYEIENQEIKEDNGKYASIDLGINNLATVASNAKDFSTFAISGKTIKSFNHYYNKKKSELQSIAELRNKKKKTNRLHRLEFIRNNKINDYMHKASRYIVNQLVSNDITVLVIGNNKEWKQDANIGKVNNQNFVEIPHMKLINMLQYKCAMAGIKVEIQEESYTSKCSFLDMEEIKKHEKYLGRRIKRGLFRSMNGSLINADVNGALNILRKCKPKAFADGIMGVVVHPKLIKSLK